MKNNRRKASNRVKQPDTISALIEKQNIWSEWSAGCWIGPLSWVATSTGLTRAIFTRTVQVRASLSQEKWK